MRYISTYNFHNIFRNHTFGRASRDLAGSSGRRLLAMRHLAYRVAAPIGLGILPVSAILTVVGGNIGYAQTATPESLSALENSIVVP